MKKIYLYYERQIPRGTGPCPSPPTWRVVWPEDVGKIRNFWDRMRWGWGRNQGFGLKYLRLTAHPRMSNIWSTPWDVPILFWYKSRIYRFLKKKNTHMGRAYPRIMLIIIWSTPSPDIKGRNIWGRSDIKPGPRPLPKSKKYMIEI